MLSVIFDLEELMIFDIDGTINRTAWETHRQWVGSLITKINTLTEENNKLKLRLLQKGVNVFGDNQ